MTEQHATVRAVARLSDPTRPSGPAVLLPGRRASHLGPLHLVQLLLAEIAIVVVVATVASGPVVVAVAAVAGIVLLLVALVHQQGRWWLERRVMLRRYARRGRARPAAGEPGLTALRTLAPGLRVTDLPVADGARVGVARDDAGWFAVVEIGTGALVPDMPAPPLPLHLLARALTDLDQPGAVLQVVRHCVPAPGLEAHPSSPVGHSYRQVLDGSHPLPIPAVATTWVAVRLDARTLAEAGAGTDLLERAPSVTAAAIRDTAKSLRRAGVPCRVLDSTGLVGALTRSCDLDPEVVGGSPPAPREEWTRWCSAGLVHRSFWLRHWPPVDQAAGLLDSLASVPSSATHVAVILAPGDRDELLDLRCLVRVSAPAEQLDRVCGGLTATAQRARADLFPLDGEQGPAAYASAPTGGGAR